MRTNRSRPDVIKACIMSLREPTPVWEESNNLPVNLNSMPSNSINFIRPHCFDTIQLQFTPCRCRLLDNHTSSKINFKWSLPYSLPVSFKRQLSHASCGKGGSNQYAGNIQLVYVIMMRASCTVKRSISSTLLIASDRSYRCVFKKVPRMLT